jgi:O-antigen/teichoic acid export membrane protein
MGCGYLVALLVKGNCAIFLLGLTATKSRWKMSTVKKLVRNSGVYITSSIINASIPFLLLPVLTRFLSLEEYGVLAVFNVWSSLLFVLCGVNVHASANRKYFDSIKGKGNDELPSFICNCLIIVLFASTFTLLTTYLLENLLKDVLNLSSSLLFLGVFLSVANVLIQLRLGQWQVRERPLPFGVFLICQSFLNMSLSLVFVVFLDFGLEGRVLGISLAVFIFSAIALTLLYKERLVFMSFNTRHIRESLRFGVPLVPHMIGAFLLLTVDRALISAKLGVESAGLYMVAVQFSLVASLLLDSVNKAISPWLYRLLNEPTIDNKKRVVKVTYFVYSLIALGVMLSFAFGPLVVEVIVGDEFKKASEFVAILILAQGLRGAYLLVSNYLFYAKKTGLIASITITTSVIYIVLLTLFLEKYGIVGGAYSLVFSMALQWLATWYFASRTIKMPWLLQKLEMREEFSN